MKCPKCEGKLKKKTFNKVNVEECDRCRGMWFDRGELSQAKNSKDKDLRWLDFDIFEVKQNKYSKKEGNRICPQDNAKMDVFIYTGSKINIDICPKCQGIWLDSDEFEKIIKYLEDKVTSETSGEYAKELIRQFTDMIEKPGDLGSEVKDFMAVLRLFEKRVEAEHPNLTYAITNLPIR